MWKIKISASRAVRGFTLIELLITTAILAMIALAIFSCLAAGLKAYGRVKNYNSSQADVLFSLEKIERDLRNTFYFTGIDFKGDSKKVSFPGLINQDLILGRISYFFDAKRGVLVKEEQPYSSSLLENNSGLINSKILAPIKEIVFIYGYINPDTHQYDWKDSWGDHSKIPQVVKIKIIFDYANKVIELDRTILIPVSG